MKIKSGRKIPVIELADKFVEPIGLTESATLTKANSNVDDVNASFTGMKAEFNLVPKACLGGIDLAKCVTWYDTYEPILNVAKPWGSQESATS